MSNAELPQINTGGGVDPAPASEPKPKPRTPAQIEADLEAARLEISRDIDALTARLDPRTQLENVKQVAGEKATEASAAAKVLIADVKAGDQAAIKKAATIGASALGAIVLVALVRRRK